MDRTDQPPATSGVNVSAQGNQTIEHSTIAHTLDQSTHHVDKSRRTKVNVGLWAAVAVVLGSGGFFAIRGLTGSPTDVVHESGLAGAQHTAEQLRTAEVDQNAANWCLLASPKDSATCHALMTNSFSTPNSLRNSQASTVGLGAATGSGSGANVPVTVSGKEIGVLSMQWDGTRWEVNPAMYVLLMNNGGIVMSALEATHGCGALLGVQTKCDG